MGDPTGAGVTVEAVFRDVYGQAVAALVRVFGDITLAEDAVQDAFVTASDRWPREGFPPNPGGWIVTTARRRAIDVARRSARGRQLEEEAGASGLVSGADATIMNDVGPVQDDRLRLIFTCCHPSLQIEHRVALTLRLLGGLSVAEVARSFLVSEAAMTKRLVRAKYKIKAAKIPYRVPSNSDLPARLEAVLAVLYLIYNTGADDRDRAQLRREAIRLARLLVELMPSEPEAAGLLALMLLNEARMPARLISNELTLLKDQDRTRWNRDLIGEGHAIVRSCVRGNQPGPYQIQAAIQAVHCDADSFDRTDWSQILTLYEQLVVYAPTPVVALNRAIAIGEVEGPEEGLAAIDDIAPDLDGYHLMHATRGTLLRRLGRRQAAYTAFGKALELAPLEADRRFFAQQIAELA
ncbi:MAG: sigma factor [Acidimicrobiia bacterium]|nr:sigma factor [Acidimicrobiia bacterium]